MPVSTPPDNSHFQDVYPDHLNTGPMLEPPEGFPFDKYSAIRHYTEPATFALFPYVAGLTVMNDQVAAAVKEHSSFTKRPWNRLFGTANAAIVLVFGNEEESLGMANQLYHFHKTVQGTRENVSYSANDADLQAWVLGAVFKGVEEANRRWGVPLTHERAGVYEDIKIFGKVFGIDPSLQPATVEEFDSYWEDTLNGDDLLRTDISREMAQTVFRFTSPKVPSPLARIGQAISIASLDPRLRERADIQETTTDRRISKAVDFVMKNTYGRTPRIAREQALPIYLTVRRRLAPLVGKLSASKA